MHSASAQTGLGLLSEQPHMFPHHAGSTESRCWFYLCEHALLSFRWQTVLFFNRQEHKISHPLTNLGNSAGRGIQLLALWLTITFFWVFCTPVYHTKCTEKITTQHINYLQIQTRQCVTNSPSPAIYICARLPVLTWLFPFSDTVYSFFTDHFAICWMLLSEIPCSWQLEEVQIPITD